MATATLEFAAIDGLTLTAELYAGGSDVLVASAACTERSNNRAVYTASLVDVATGTYRLRIRNASNQTIMQDWLDHTNTAATEYPRRDITPTEVDTTLTASHGAGAWNTNEIGSGGDLCTITITVNGSPVPDADVWITSDASGNTVVAGTRQTDSNGKVPFLLDDGNTYYLWMQKDGYNSIQGQQFTAVAD